MKDYIIFDKAPKLVFYYNEENYPFSDWYTKVTRATNPRPEVPGILAATNCPEEYVFNNFNLQYLRVRGNYTANYQKKSLKIKFEEKQSLFGLNNGKKAKEWVLISDYGDNSLLRDALAFYLGQQILETQWSPTFTFVQVYINGGDGEKYLGLYLLCDQKEVGKNRVNINEPEKNYTGVDIGYFFERDDYYDPNKDDPGFIIEYPNGYLPSPLEVISHPTNKYYGIGAVVRDGYTIHSKIYSEDQENFIQNYMRLIYTILYEACINNNYLELSSTDINSWQDWTLVESQETDPIKVVSKVIDLSSFINMYILQEFVGNPDLAHSSFYFCLDASVEGNKKLALTCPWDHDRTLGLCDGLKDASYNELWVKDAHYNPWVAILPQAEWFVDLLKQRWQQLYDKCIFRKALDMLNDYTESYKNDFDLNFQKYAIDWSDIPRDARNPIVAASINSRFYLNVKTHEDCKNLLYTWIDSRFKALHIILDGKGSTDWPEPPEPDPGKAGQIFRKDKLVQIYTVETWNEMYNNAAKNADELTKLWNLLYACPSNAAVILYNKMYAAVASGKKLTDPELQAELEAWNRQAAR